MRTPNPSVLLALAAGLSVSLSALAAVPGVGGAPAPAPRNGLILPAAAAPGPGVLALRTGNVFTNQLPNLLAPVAGARPQPLPQAFRSVLQLDGPLSPARRAQLEQAGVRLGAYLPETAFMADLSAANLPQVAALGFVRWAGAWDAAWKIDPQIANQPFSTPERQALATGGEAFVIVYLFQGESLDAAGAKVAQIPGAALIDSGEVAGDRVLGVRLPRAALPQLAAIDEVRFVENQPEITNRSNTNTRWIIQTNVASQTPLYTAGITGLGQIVGVIDDGFTAAHCSFSDPLVPISAANTPGVFPTHRKIAAYNATYGYQVHGTHVAGIAAGNQSPGVDDNTRGIAYDARICYNRYSSNFSTYDFNGALVLHHNQGARVHTNSWGDDGTTAYNVLARAIDVFSYNNETSVVMFASTNLTTLKNPENAKSSVSVGRSGGAGSTESTCNGNLSGPTSDGRRKPELFAPGCSVVSSTGSTGCGTTSLTGTSMASPAVAGAAVLIRQYFTDGFYPTGSAVPSNSLVPSGALLRGMLINSATDLTNYPSPNQLPPDNFEGFGRIRISDSVFLTGDARKLILRDVFNTSPQALATGQTSSFEFDVTSGAEPLEVTLTFTDAPATVNAAFAPVNNIDLRVIDPANNIYLGNVFNPATGQSQTGGTADAINSAENVLLASPALGRWRVEIVGTGVNVGTQGFAVVATGAIAPPPVPPTCPANFDADGCLSPNDIFAFLTAYFASNLAADFDGNTLLQPADIFAFLNAYFAGCPRLPGC